ncbi:condensation domain-containing protein [Nocardia sp. NBC_00508]|uniref:type I polyketide synthase n=1 Tax=Nocardia sp. NBC_00508 TaxID=2975992 RepID=UPI002E824B69|nr:beta-ketoacyl synthase N-terminal-like domain-containing protein [Nocardia sp. NBC_00508]WUD66571.1 condensation domain-containing protein [Nocardia sp. NBC_00508]
MSKVTAADDSGIENSTAIVGIAGKFPGAESVEEFWDNLRAGRESIVDISDDTLIESGVPESVFRRPNYVRRAPILADIDKFDAEFFGFTPRAARIMDPQHRLFLQTAWKALEDACCDPYRYDGAIGVFGSSAASGYLLHNLLSHGDLRESIAQGANAELLNLLIHNDKDYLATRLSHQFNLRGPSLTVQTACSSSLVAVHMACQSLLSNECDMALAGAVSLRIPHHVGYFYEPGSMASASGHCRPFDARADGTVFGSGAGIVVLKRLEDALAADDIVHAVIAGSAVNNDGSRKMAFTAPNVAAQADVIAEAQAVAGVDSSDISYIEAHGTGTPLGDPIELDALRRAFEISTKQRSAPCYIGSVKSNIGHLEVASGVVGLIKTVLSLKNRAIPPTLHFEKPNPELRLDRSPFVAPTEYRPWEWDGLRYAGVSSFGVGGTNAHVVVHEAPAVAAAPSRFGPQVLLLSANTREALAESQGRLAAHLDANPELDLLDVAYTLDRGRKPHQVRAATVVNDRGTAARALTGRGNEPKTVLDPDPAVAFLFPGQGTQHLGMARDLVESEPVFAETFNRCLDEFHRLSGRDIRSAIFGSDPARLNRTDYAQPAIFAVEYALAKLLESYGVRPAALIGHSIGEYVAGTVAGVFDLDTAIRAVVARADLMHAAPTGAMLAVASAVGDLADGLGPELDVAAINDPHQCVVSGSTQRVEEFERWSAGRGILTRRLDVSHAFHSGLMEPVVPKFEDVLRELPLAEPKIPLLSNRSGSWMSAAEATDPAVWARSIRATVRFKDNIEHALDTAPYVFVEVGPGGSLSASVKRHQSWTEDNHVVRLMRRPSENTNDREVFLGGLGLLWTAGVGIDWSPRYSGATARWASLPTYPFARERYWIDAAPVVAGEPGAVDAAESPRDVSGRVSAPSETAEDVGGVRAIEIMLSEIANEVIGVDHLDLDMNFFDLGVDSLMAVGFVRRALESGADIEPQDLLENQTIRLLARAVYERSLSSEGESAATPEAEAADSVTGPDILAEFTAAELTAIADQLGGPRPGTPLSGNEIEDIYPLSPVQRDTLEHVLADGGAGVFLEQLVATLVGPLDVELFREATQRVVDRHPALRTSIASNGDSGPLQVVRRHATIPFVVEDATTSEGRAVAEREREFIARDRRQGFDLASAPLIRITIVKVAEDRHRIVWTHHRMLLDGTSFAMVVAETAARYQGLKAGRQNASKAARPFRDYISWVRELDGDADEEFWRAELNGMKSNALKQIRPAQAPAASGEGDAQPVVAVELTAAQTAHVTETLRAQRVTLATVAYGAWAGVVGRHSGESDVTIGAAVSGRFGPSAGMEQIVGAFSNVLPLRVSIDPSVSTGDWLRQLQSHVTSLRSFEHVAPPALAPWSGVPAGRPLFETAVSVAVHAYEGMDVGFADVSFEDVDVHLRSNIPLWVMVIPGAEISFRVIYHPTRIDAAEARSLLEDWVSMFLELVGEERPGVDGEQ